MILSAVGMRLSYHATLRRADRPAASFLASTEKLGKQIRLPSIRVGDEDFALAGAGRRPGPLRRRSAAAIV